MKDLLFTFGFLFLIVFCNPISLFCIICLSPLGRGIKGLFKGLKKSTKSNKKLKKNSAILASPRWIIVGKEN